jgi:hypothetical protein
MLWLEILFSTLRRIGKYVLTGTLAVDKPVHELALVQFASMVDIPSLSSSLGYISIACWLFAQLP